MRRFPILFVCGFFLGASPGLAEDSNGAMATCGSHNVKIAATDRISACTTVIDSGELSGSNLAIAHAFRGMGYKIDKDFTRAVADFSDAIRIDPTSTFAYLARASTYLQEANVSAAIADLSEVIRLDPKSAVAFYLRGAAEARLGETDESKADVARSLAIDPDVEREFE